MLASWTRRRNQLRGLEWRRHRTQRFLRTLPAFAPREAREALQDQSAQLDLLISRLAVVRPMLDIKQRGLVGVLIRRWVVSAVLVLGVSLLARSLGPPGSTPVHWLEFGLFAGMARSFLRIVPRTTRKRSWQWQEAAHGRQAGGPSARTMLGFCSRSGLRVWSGLLLPCVLLPLAGAAAVPWAGLAALLVALWVCRDPLLCLRHLARPPYALVLSGSSRAATRLQARVMAEAPHRRILSLLDTEEQHMATETPLHGLDEDSVHEVLQFDVLRLARGRDDQTPTDGSDDEVDDRSGWFALICDLAEQAGFTFADLRLVTRHLARELRMLSDKDLVRLRHNRRLLRSIPFSHESQRPRGAAGELFDEIWKPDDPIVTEDQLIEIIRQLAEGRTPRYDGPID